MPITSIKVNKKPNVNYVIRCCVWCGSEMRTERQSMRVCSQFCNNQLSYVFRTQFKTQLASRNEFVSYLENQIKQLGIHPANKRHPLYKEPVNAA